MALGEVSIQAQFVFEESFKNSTAPNWAFQAYSGSTTPFLTSNTNTDANNGQATTSSPSGKIDTTGDGWLRMTTAQTNQSTATYLNVAIPSAGNTVTLTFDYAKWGGTGADGFVVGFFDATVGSFSPGGYGGSMGYASRTDVGSLGLSGGYVGIGYDDFGNFSNPTEGRNGGPGANTNNITIRGPTTTDASTSTPFLSTVDLSSQMDFPGNTYRPGQTGVDFRQTKIILDSENYVTVYMRNGVTGEMDLVLTQDLSGFTRPDNLMLAFTAGTGASTNFHEIRNVSITTTTGAIGGTLWDRGASTNTWTDGNNWSPNGVPATYADVEFNNAKSGLSGSQSVTLNGDKTVRSINIGGADGYTISGDKITLDDGGRGGVPGINSYGTQASTISSIIELNDSSTINQVSTGKLTIGTGEVRLGSNTLTVKGTGDVDITGNIKNGGNLVKEGTGTLTLTAANDMSGSTTVKKGTMTLSGANGALGSTSSVTVYCGANIILENTTNANSGRLNNSAPINFYGGQLTVNGHSSTDIQEDVGTINLIRDNAKIVMDAQAGAGINLRVNAMGTRNTGATLYVAGEDLGEFSAGTNGAANITYASAPTLVGGGGALASNTTSILYYATGRDTNGGAYGLVTHSTNGLRLLTNYQTGTTSPSWGSTENVRPSGDVTLGGNTTVNALVLDSGIDITDSGTATRNLTITNSAILKTGATDSVITLSNTGNVLTSGTTRNELIMSVMETGKLTINGAIADNGNAVAVTKTGSGTLEYSGTRANTYTGNTYVNEGTLLLNKSAGTNAIAGGDITVNCEGTLLLGASNQIANGGTVDVTMNGGTFDTGGFSEDGLGVLTLTGNATINLGSGTGSVLKFADSSGATWDPDAVLSVTGWSDYNADQLFFGTTGSGLTAQQASQVVFVNPGGLTGTYYSMKLSDGQIVPVIPEPSTYVAAGLLLASLAWREIRRRRKMTAALSA